MSYEICSHKLQQITISYCLPYNGKEEGDDVQNKLWRKVRRKRITTAASQEWLFAEWTWLGIGDPKRKEKELKDNKEELESIADNIKSR